MDGWVNEWIDGWMDTGWLRSGGEWYYLSDSGAMRTGWQKIGGSWYHFAGSGAMDTGWEEQRCLLIEEGVPFRDEFHVDIGMHAGLLGRRV